jgi:hypothetical protein
MVDTDTPVRPAVPMLHVPCTDTYYSTVLDGNKALTSMRGTRVDISIVVLKLRPLLFL